MTSKWVWSKLWIQVKHLFGTLYYIYLQINYPQVILCSSFFLFILFPLFVSLLLFLLLLSLFYYSVLIHSLCSYCTYTLSYTLFKFFCLWILASTIDTKMNLLSTYLNTEVGLIFTPSSTFVTAICQHTENVFPPNLAPTSELMK
jgi:hypothetical protein